MRYFRVFLVILSIQILSLCIHSLWFYITRPFFCKKLRFSYTLQDFLFGIEIWFWDVENLGSSHHVSIVHGSLVAYIICNDILVYISEKQKCRPLPKKQLLLNWKGHKTARYQRWGLDSKQGHILIGFLLLILSFKTN